MSAQRPEEAAGSVDVVIPCYQYGRFLRDCVTSVLRQGVQDVRVLIIDNASTDNSVEVAQQLAAEDRRVEVVVHPRNLGPHASFNEGVDWASSKYFVILCADDLLAPGCLASAVAILERHPAVGFAYWGAASLQPNEPMPRLDNDATGPSWQIVGGEALIEQFCRDGVNHIAASCTMVRTTVQKLAGHYRTALPHTDDFEMWMRLACLGPAARTASHLAIRRFHGAARSAHARSVANKAYNHSPAMPWHDEAAFESFFAHEGASLPAAARLHRLVRRSLPERAYWSAVAHVCRGESSASWDLFKFALSRRPSFAILPPLGYLFRRENAIGKIRSIAAELARRSRGPAATVAASG
jgi:glycosyltransferase involved in cell wall biosynthesis